MSALVLNGSHVMCIKHSYLHAITDSLWSRAMVIVQFRDGRDDACFVRAAASAKARSFETWCSESNGKVSEATAAQEIEDLPLPETVEAAARNGRKGLSLIMISMQQVVRSLLSLFMGCWQELVHSVGLRSCSWVQFSSAKSG